jgi:hypothetical protein
MDKSLTRHKDWTNEVTVLPREIKCERECFHERYIASYLRQEKLPPIRKYNKTYSCEPVVAYLLRARIVEPWEQPLLKLYTLATIEQDAYAIRF